MEKPNDKPEVKPETKTPQTIPTDMVKVVRGGITRIVHKNKVSDFKKLGYVEF